MTWAGATVIILRVVSVNALRSVHICMNGCAWSTQQQHKAAGPILRETLWEADKGGLCFLQRELLPNHVYLMGSVFVHTRNADNGFKSKNLWNYALFTLPKKDSHTFLYDIFVFHFKVMYWKYHQKVWKSRVYAQVFNCGFNLLAFAEKLEVNIFETVRHWTYFLNFWHFSLDWKCATGLIKELKCCSIYFQLIYYVSEVYQASQPRKKIGWK